MLGERSHQLFRVFGIRIGASTSWFLILFLMIYWLSDYFTRVLPRESDTTAYLIAVAATMLFFVSLLLHELGHALVARRHGIETAGIDLWLFGGVAKLSRDSRSPKEEFQVAAAGPGRHGADRARVPRHRRGRLALRRRPRHGEPARRRQHTRASP